MTNKPEQQARAEGAKASVLFFDKKPASEAPWTKRLWIYDPRMIAGDLNGPERPA